MSSDIHQVLTVMTFWNLNIKNTFLGLEKEGY
jgi:hypothetical protein